MLIGSALGAFVDRRFFALPAGVAGFLLHSARGRAGARRCRCCAAPEVRTASGIDFERYDTLKAIRGDFEQVAGAGARVDVAEAIQAARE